MSETLGRRHPTVRRLRRLRRDPALRREESVLVAEGLHLAQEALTAGAEIELVATAPRLNAGPEGRSLHTEIERRGLNRVELEDALLDSLQDARSPQPILMVVRRPRRAEAEGLTGTTPSPLVTVAVGIQDPGNLGSLMRTADAGGATACLVVPPCADPYHPRAARASMGSIFRLPLHHVAQAELFDRLRGHGLRSIAADPKAGGHAASIDFTGPTAILFGAEGSGLPTPLRAAVDCSVRIPMRPGVESLSVGAAAAVLIFEADRQRRARTG